MLLQVTTFAGQEIELDVDAADTIDSVKARIQRGQDLPPHHLPYTQILIHDGAPLEGPRTVAECGLSERTRVQTERPHVIVVDDRRADGVFDSGGPLKPFGDWLSVKMHLPDGRSIAIGIRRKGTTFGDVTRELKALCGIPNGADYCFTDDATEKGECNAEYVPGECIVFDSQCYLIPREEAGPRYW